MQGGQFLLCLLMLQKKHGLLVPLFIFCHGRDYTALEI